jgi:glycosyltransferase involved in cell wall biosynthesis
VRAPSGRRLGLLFVLTSPVRGGVEEVVLRLLERLDPAEFRLGLAAPAALLDAFGPELASAGVAAHDVAAESWLRPREVERLAAVIRRFEPDVVNAHLFRATAVAAPLARMLRVPAVVETYHGREGWRRGPIRGSFAVDRLVARFADRVIAVSAAARDFLVGTKGYPAEKVVVVPNGRDLSVFRPGHHGAETRAGLGIAPGTPLVGVVGRLDAQKGHVHLLDAWPLVVREFPAARLLVVGDGALRPDLEQRARDRGVAASVVFTGFRADVPQLLDAVDLLVLPSLYEGMPLTAIEASAMARPVIATAVDGTPEVIRDGHTGQLVPPANPAALARAILDMLRDPGRARRLGEAGRAHVLEHFGLDRHVEATARVYRSAGRRSARR